MKKWYKLDDIADFTNANNFFKLSATPTFDALATPIDIWTETDFEEVFEQQSEKSIYLKESEDAWAGFKSKYSAWIDRNKRFIADELAALFSKYNPIHNYNKHEEHSGDDTTTKTPDDWKKTVTETPDEFKRTETHKASQDYKLIDTQKPEEWEKTFETIGTDNDNKTATENKIIPFNGSSFANVNRSETVSSLRNKETQDGTFATEHTQQGERSIEVTEEGSRVTTEEQAGTFEDKTEYGHIIDISGNVGVTTTATMIREILALYDVDFVERWITRFFNKYCAYVR